MRRALRQPWVLHLRLPFNLLLAPLFVWGALLAGAAGAVGAGGAPPWRVAAAFVALHVFLYGGANAFNSFYDRDEGPIGGLLEPPPVDRGLLGFSLVWQGLGAPLALAAGAAFATVWGALALVFAAYSHPAVRLKRDPRAALAAIGLGQGALGFAAGWLASGAAPRTLGSLDAALGMAAATLVVLGLYLVTQSYQSAEDAARGDRTLVVVLGPRRALQLALLPLGVGGALLLTRVAAHWGAAWSVALTTLFGGLGGALLAWSLRFDPDDTRGEFRRTMRFLTVAALLLAGFAGVLWGVG